VFDSPHVKILVGKKNRTRRRLDAKSVVQLVRSFDAPIGILYFSTFISISLHKCEDLFLNFIFWLCASTNYFCLFNKR